MLASEPLLTAEEFLDMRFDFPESGQWSELTAGRPVHLQPPDLDHGNTILNLSKQLAEFTKTSSGYPCFDLGLQLQCNPDTVWFPAVSYFSGGPRFAEMDHIATGTVPAVVMELASTADRRRPMPARVNRYLAWGIEQVWVIDPAAQSVEVVSPQNPQEPINWHRTDQLVGSGSLAGLQLSVAELFSEPSWW